MQSFAVERTTRRQPAYVTASCGHAGRRARGHARGHTRGHARGHARVSTNSYVEISVDRLDTPSSSTPPGDGATAIDAYHSACPWPIHRI